MQHGIVEELGRIPMAPNLAATLVRAAETARSQSAPAVTLEHLLLALTDDPDAGMILQVSNIDAARLRNDLFAQLAATARPPPAGAPGDVVISQDLRRVLEASAAAAQQGRRREINGAIVLAAIVGDGRSVAAQMLRAHGMTFEDAIKALQRAVQSQAPRPQAAAPPQAAPPQAEAPIPAPPQPPSSNQSAGQSTEDLLATVRERIGGPHAAKPQPAASDTDVPTTRPPPQIFAPPPPAPPRPAAPYEPQWEAAALPPAQSAPQGAHPQQAPAPPPPSQRPVPPQQPNAEIVPRTQPPSRPAPPPMPAAAPPAARAAPPPMPESVRPAAAPWPEPLAQEPPRRPQPTVNLPPPVAMPGAYDSPAQSGRPAGSRTPQAGPRTGPPQQHAGSQADRRAAAPPAVEPGQLVENIPRKMRSGVPSPVEVRIGRDKIQGLAKGMPGQVTQHAVKVTRAMSVRLRAPDGGFFIETASPETQWIDNTLGVHADDFASWRWLVTPKARGRRRLQLVISARTVGPDGLAAETALPEQVIDVKVTVNYATAAKRAAGWLAATILGGALAKFGEGGLDAARALVKSLGGG